MEETEEKEKALRAAQKKEDKEVLLELGKYLEAVVEAVTTKESTDATLDEKIEAEKKLHSAATDVFEKAKQKLQTEEEIEGLVGTANSLLQLLQK